MVVGMLLSGVAAGLLGVFWSLVAGQGILMALIAYPAAGIMGSLVFLAVAMTRALSVSQQSEIMLAAETN